MNLAQRRKLATSIVIFCVAGGALVAHRSPATKYEVSIYSAVSPIFWVLVMVAVGTSFLLCLAETIRRKGYDKWPWGPLLSIPSMALIQLLPLIRGYYLYGRNDVLTYIGTTIDLRSSGHLAADNFYPLLHMMSVEVSLLASSSLATDFELILPLLYLVFS